MSQGQSPGYVRLERHMDAQARLMRVADEMRQIAAQLEAEAREARLAARHTKGR